MDGQWRCSKYHSVCLDWKGNVNNFIDLTQAESITTLPIHVPLKEANPHAEYQTTPTGNYLSQIPRKIDMNVDAVLCPDNYKYLYNIDFMSNQELLGKHEYINNKLVYGQGNTSFLPISIPPHVDLNHICNKKINNKKGVLITSSSQRVKNKYLTVIYYNPSKMKREI